MSEESKITKQLFGWNTKERERLEIENTRLVGKNNYLLTRLKEAIAEIDKFANDTFPGEEKQHFGMQYSLDILKQHIPEAFEEVDNADE